MYVPMPKTKRSSAFEEGRIVGFDGFECLELSLHASCGIQYQRQCGVSA